MDCVYAICIRTTKEFRDYLCVDTGQGCIRRYIEKDIKDSEDQWCKLCSSKIEMIESYFSFK